ncbi:MAG: TIGR02300 family protein, partial [Pseudomonadota bacterium]
MAKPEWGVKRICQSCGARFYDLMRSPIVCPKCETEFDPEAWMRSRRVRASEKPKAPKPAPVQAEASNDDDDDMEDDAILEDDDDD